MTEVLFFFFRVNWSFKSPLIKTRSDEEEEEEEEEVCLLHITPLF